MAATDGGLLPEGVKKQLGKFDEALTRMEAELKTVMSDDFKEEEAALPPLERAKVHVILAQAVNSLFCMYLRTQGISPVDHPAHKEARRLQAYLDKVKKASDKDIQLKHRPTASIDVASANRFITGAIPELTEEQRAKLKAAGERERARGFGKAAGKAAAGVAGTGKGAKAAEAADAFLDSLGGEALGGGGGGKGKRGGGQGSVGKPGKKSRR